MARGQAGPPPVVLVAAAVTSCRHHAGPAVLNGHTFYWARGSAAVVGGDVLGTDQIPVPGEVAVPTVEAAAGWFRDFPLAGRAGGGGAALVHHANLDAGAFGLVPESSHEVGAAPLAQTQVLYPANILAGDESGIANQQRRNSLSNCEGDRLLGSFMLGLMDAAAMTGLDPTQLGPMASPAPRAALARPGGSAGRLRLAGLLIVQVQKALGPDRPARYQQGGLVGDHRVGVDDAKVHTGYPTGIQLVLVDGNGGGHRDPQPPSIGQQGDRPDVVGGVGNGARQPDP
jgi:hypothetical protein